jgi:hypothetical protein
MNYTVKQSIIATNCINNVEYVSYINSNILYSLNVRLISLVLLSFFLSLFKIFKHMFKCLYTISTSYSRFHFFTCTYFLLVSKILNVYCLCFVLLSLIHVYNFVYIAFVLCYISYFNKHLCLVLTSQQIH